MGQLGTGAATAIQAGTNVATTLINQAFAEHNRKRNFYYNEKAADAADERQRAQYRDLYSPIAQLEQIKDAGLSPSLMLGNGASAVGHGQAMGNMSMGATGAQGPIMSPIDLSQIKLNQALANKADKEGEVIEKTGTDLNLSTIAKNLADAGHKEQATKVLAVEEELNKLQLTVSIGKSQYEIEKAMHEASVAYYQSVKLEEEGKAIKLQNKFDLETYKDRVNQVSANYNKTLSESALNWANKELSDEQCKQLIEQVAIARYNADTQRLSQEGQKEFYQAQVEQWAKQNGFTEAELKHEKTKKWLEFTSKIIGSLCYVAGAAI